MVDREAYIQVFVAHHGRSSPHIGIFIVNKNVFPYLFLVKTTIDLPDALLEQTKIAAARRRSSIKNLVIEGLKMVLGDEASSTVPQDALARLRPGYHLGGQPLTREQTHAR